MSKLGRTGPRARLVAACLSFGIAWACGAPSVDSSPTDFALGSGGAQTLALPAGSPVEYVVDWSWEGAEATNGGFRFANDLGFRFEIETFRVATYSAQLVSCEPAAWLHWGLSKAHAHHVSINDPSMYVAQRSEDALTEHFSSLGVGTASGGEYCSAFLLFTPLPEGAPELGGNAIWFAGTYEDGEGNRQPMQGQIPQGDGALGTLASAIPSALPLDGEAARVVFVRFPARAFGGIDPSELSALKLGWEVLKGLVATTEVRWQVASD